MHPMPQSNAVNLKAPKAVLLGTSALVFLALAAPVMADDFVITGSDNSTNGTGTTNGGTAAAIADTAINGSDTVSLGIALTTTGTNVGIKTNNNGTEAQSNTVTVTKTGSITTGTGNKAYGIWNKGDTNTTTVSGSITTGGNYAYGIWNQGDDNKTTVSGSIETTGAGADGIFNDGNDNTTTISGSIETGSYGIFNDGNDNTTTISGSIETTGLGGYGIENDGDSNTTTVSGDIVTREAYGHGIFNEGDYNKTTVSGDIVTREAYGHGIVDYGSNNTTTVSGSITTDGTVAYGIYNEGSNNTTTISGTVKATGASSVALYNTEGDGNSFTISGTVKATGAKSAALYNYSGSGNSFTLDEGATIIGDILARDNVATINSELIFNLGASTSYAYSVSGKGEGTGGGQWIFSDLDRSSQVVTTTGTGCDTTMSAGNDTCNLVTGVSTGNLEAQDELQFSMNSSMIGSLSLGSSNFAAPVEAMSFAQTPQNNAWFNIYGDTSDRSASTTKLAFDGSNRGLTIGTPVAISDTLNLDLVFNASNANLDIGSAKAQQITARSYNVGAVLRDLAPSTGWAVDAFGFVGRNSYDGKRKVMNNQEATGSETVTAAYSGSEVLVGVDAQYSNPVTDTLNFIGGVNASFSNEKIGAYSESKYFSWDARTMTQASGGITAGLEHSKDALTTFASVGLQGSSLRSGKTATFTNNGTAGSFTDNSRGSIYRSVTVGFDYAGSESMTLSGALEGFSSTGGVSGNSASLTANWSF
ncbi:autotransporter domain-containing protein [Planktomarina temperata]|nr:autotransporter domain-containing protein [Planktomarina temperata]